MTIKINRLMLDVDTEDGQYGVDVTLSEGLFILRVDNTYGKSTFINSIAYALGMEMALGQTSSKPPFPPSLLKKIRGKNGVEHLVMSSVVFLEIENGSGSAVTLKRNILGADADSIISIYESSIDDVDEKSSRDYFIHKEGDTTREDGFYFWLSKYFGWKLPLVPNSYGGESPLYPALLFPLYFVEQKKGWSSIQATTPYNFKIHQAKKRAFEFLMDLDVNEIVKKKARNKTLLEENSKDWNVSYLHFDIEARKSGGKLVGISEKPVAKFDPYKVDVLVNCDDKWSSVSSALRSTKIKLATHKESIPNVIEVGGHSRKIAELLELIANSDEKYEDLLKQTFYLKSQVVSSNRRVNSLVEDKRKYEDLKKIKTFTIFKDMPVLDNLCPTCGREFSEHNVKSTLSCSDNLMTLDESLDFIKSQLSTFKSATLSYQNQLGAKNIELERAKEEVDLYSNELNRIKSGISSLNDSTSEEYLRRKILLENQIELYEDTIVKIGEFRNRFDFLHGNDMELKRLRKSFPEFGFSNKDRKKLKSLKSSVIKHLKEFGFSSFDPDLLTISEDSYLPTREGYDLGFDTSASDGIRVIWSYLMSLFAMREQFNTNHTGFLIFDEPRQQEANKVSFTGLLRGASEIAKKGQIIFATSEEEDSIKNILKGCDYNFQSFSTEDGKILRKRD